MRIGTASVRRKAQLLAHDPSLSIEPLRGNVDTRLRKRGERGLDAIVLAAAGLDRLGLADEIGLRLDPAVMLPEAGQGAVALQVRAGEEELVAGSRRRGDPAAGRGSSARASRGSAAAASRRSPRTTTGPSCTRSSPPRTGRWVERRTGDDPLALADELLAAVG